MPPLVWSKNTLSIGNFLAARKNSNQIILNQIKSRKLKSKQNISNQTHSKQIKSNPNKSNQIQLIQNKSNQTHLKNKIISNQIETNQLKSFVNFPFYRFVQDSNNNRNDSSLSGPGIPQTIQQPLTFDILTNQHFDILTF